MRRSSALFIVCALIACTRVSTSQQASGSAGCSLPAPQFELRKPNIFTAQQEEWLGEAQASQLEPDYDLLPEKESLELDLIGHKLLAQLPATPIPYHFRVYEAVDANGFSIAGGYVYISRKLITDAHSEDEVAGVLAHEIGHIYTHQVAIEFTRQLKAMLNITTVSSREDVQDKVQMLLNAPWKDRADQSEDEEEKDELLADRVGLYALIKAGYAASAFSENLDRIAANKGRTGNLLTDILGATDPLSLRVRVARKIADSVPEGCKRQDPGFSTEFKAFQEAVRSVPVHPLIEPTPGLESIKLEPPMRQSLEQVRFSPDGKLILAQDETSIHVLSRWPLKRLFSIDAPWALPAHFTPDSAHVVFNYATMRVEKWEVATGKRESSHELVDYDGCEQTSLSPDGRTFACLSFNHAGVWLKLSDVESGKVFYDNKTYFGASNAGAEIIVRSGGGKRVGTVVYAQDGRTMLILAGAKSLAFDLGERKPIALGKDFSHMVDGRTAFVDSDKLVFQCDWAEMQTSSKDTFKLCEASFPDGLPVNSFRVGYQWIEPVMKGNYLLIGPFKDNAAMLVDPSTGKASAGFKLDSLDVFGSTVASENEHGVSVGELGGEQMESAELPVGPMMRVDAAAFSPDGRFLAYSSKSRSSIWDLSTQKRVALMRPFRGVRFDDQEQMYAQYQASNQRSGQNYHIDLKTGKATEGSKYEIDQFQYGDVLITFQPMEMTGTINSNINLVVSDVVTGALLWTRRFPHETPSVRRTEDGSLLLISDLIEQTATDESNHAGGKLVKASDTTGRWDAKGLLIEVVASRTGEIKREVMVPEHVSDNQRTAALYGDYLVVRGNANNSVIYRVSDGKRLGAFYGRAIAGDSKLGLIASTNRDQDVILYDAATGKELKRVTVDQLPRAVQFIADKNALLVLTASQRVYSIDLPAMGQAEAAQAK